MAKPAGYLLNTASGLQGECGVFYDYVLTSNGLFLRAKNPQLAVTVCIAPQDIRGLAPLKEEIQLLHGKIPLHFLNLALSILCIKPDIEQYMAVTWQGNYSLNVPSQLQTAGSVTYETLPGTVLDIHSHAGGVPAHFSGIDDRDEQGLGLYAVVGDLHNLCPTIELRLGIYGYFMPLGKEDIFV
jgi:PRTRC genetic system protein A